MGTPDQPSRTYRQFGSGRITSCCRIRDSRQFCASASRLWLGQDRLGAGDPGTGKFLHGIRCLLLPVPFAVRSPAQGYAGRDPITNRTRPDSVVRPARSCWLQWEAGCLEPLSLPSLPLTPWSTKEVAMNYCYRPHSIVLAVIVL